MDIFLAVSQILLLGLITYFIFTRDKREREQTFKQQNELHEIYAAVIDTIVNNQRLIIEDVASLNKEFFKQISQHSIKSQSTMEKLALNLVKLSEKPREVKEIIREEPKRIDNFNLVTNLPLPNPIEKEDDPEIELADMPRIPLISGANLKFEDEPGVYPLDIYPVGSVQPSSPPPNNITNGSIT